MSHKTTTTSTSSTKVKYSAYTGTDTHPHAEPKQKQTQKYIVKNYTKTPVIENPSRHYDPMQTRKPIGNWGYKVVETKEETRLQWFVKAFLKVGSRIKDRVLAFFRFKRKK